MLTCKVGFKQNVGHLGSTVVVMGVHGNFQTMKIKWKRTWVRFWDQLADKIKEFAVEILAGDFNMSLTRVVPELRSRGLEVDCVAWYPWLHSTERNVSSPFGFDSCGMFYIGGTVQVSPSYSLDHLVDLTTVVSAVAAPPSLPPPRLTAVAETLGLDTYEGQFPPSHYWKSYRSRAFLESDKDKDLTARLTEMLTPSTSQVYLDAIPKRQGYCYCPYLRFAQKQMRKYDWFVDGKICGDHFPLCIFTK